MRGGPSGGITIRMNYNAPDRPSSFNNGFLFIAVVWRVGRIVEAALRASNRAPAVSVSRRTISGATSGAELGRAAAGLTATTAPFPLLLLFVLLVLFLLRRRLFPSFHQFLLSFLSFFLLLFIDLPMLFIVFTVGTAHDLLKPSQPISYLAFCRHVPPILCRGAPVDVLRCGDLSGLRLRSP